MSLEAKVLKEINVFFFFFLHQNLKYTFSAFWKKSKKQNKTKKLPMKMENIDVLELTPKEGDVPCFSLVSQPELQDCTELHQVCRPWIRNMWLNSAMCRLQTLHFFMFES